MASFPSSETDKVMDNELNPTEIYCQGGYSKGQEFLVSVTKLLESVRKVLAIARKVIASVRNVLVTAMMFLVSGRC